MNEDGRTLSDLKVQELRQALVSRTLDGNGVKATLISRLEKALTEQGIESELFYFTIKNEINRGEEIQNVEENVVKNDFVNDIFKEQLNNEPKIANNDYQEKILKNEKFNDEIDQAELNGEEEEILVEDSQNSKKEIKNDVNQKENETQNNSGYVLHEISDAEDVDEILEEGPEEDSKNVDGSILNKEESLTVTSTTTKIGEINQTSVANKLPSGLQFPKDDPQGKRCIWIRGIPIQTRISDLKLAFMDAGFNGEAKIFLTKHATRPSAFGYMIFDSEDAAKAAVTKMHNSIFKGKTITVERACDSSMLQTDLIPPQPERERQRVHPPIKPPEKTTVEKPKKLPVKTVTKERSPPKEKLVYVEKITPVEERRRRSSPYRNTVTRARVIRESVRQQPPRRIIGNGSKIRVLAARSPDPYERRIRRQQSPPPIRRIEENRLAEERRRFDEEIRRKEEEFSRRERLFKAEAEANKIKLERERLARENLELKLKIQQQERERERERRRSPPKRRTPPIQRKRSRSPLGPSPSSKSAHRPRSPLRRSPIRRVSPLRNHHYHEPSTKEIYGARRRSRTPVDRRPIIDNRRQQDSRITLRYDDGYGRPAPPLRRSPINERPQSQSHRGTFEQRDRSRNTVKSESNFRDERERSDHNSRREHYPSVNDSTTNHRDPPNFSRNADYPSYSTVTSTSQFVQQPVFPTSNNRSILPTPSTTGWPTQTLTPSQFAQGIVPSNSPWPSVPSTLPTWGTSASQSFNPSNSRYRF